MSHITHLYHLSALDYVNACFLGAPWSPTFTNSTMIVADDFVDGTGSGTTAIANHLVADYVEALTIRRKMHVAGALFAGRFPIQNALVPGGVTTLFSSTYPRVAGTNDDKFGPFNSTEIQSKFASLIKEVGTFINTKYIPDVLTVAYHYGSPAGTLINPPGYFALSGCKRFLSYGDFPQDGNGTLAIKRGLVDWSSGTVNTTVIAFNQANILEYVGSSHYEYETLDPLGLHPFDGKTTPNMNSGGYSWLKAPRYNFGTPTAIDARVCEVGPLARMVVSFVANGPTTVNDSYTSPGGVRVNGNYTVRELVNVGLNAALSYTVAINTSMRPLQDYTYLSSALGRHAARALEAKFLCDYIANEVAGLTAGLQTYTYAKIPKTISTGFGLCEAPRGALGHWIKITGKKVAKYQCVVPSTWNFSPKATGTTDNGAVEQALIDTRLGATPELMILNVLRVVHPFDCCIACAVHVVSPEGKDIVKFAIGPDGRPTNIEIAK